MKKFLFLLYGVVAYSVFFVAFLYAIGFITRLFVPKHVDSPAVIDLGFPLLINALLLGLFAIQHSVMARPGFKRWWAKYVPVPLERSTFVLLASLLLIAMYILWQPMTATIWNVQHGILPAVLTGVSLVGWGIVFVSTFIINHFDLFGLRQVWLYFTGKPYTHLEFKKRGFYKYVRHPLMLGFLIAFWATPHMTAGHLIFALLTTGYILIALILEEKDLVNTHGEAYLRYKREVPKLIPFTKRRYRGITKPVQPSSWKETSGKPGQ